MQKMLLACSRVERIKTHFLEGTHQLMLRMDTSSMHIPWLRTSNILLSTPSLSFTTIQDVQVTPSFEETCLHRENSYQNLWGKRNLEKFLISYIFYTI